MMGIYEEDKPLNGHVITTIPDKTDCLYEPKTQVHSLKKNKGHFQIVSMLMNIILIAALITLITLVSTKRSRSCDVNNKESEKNVSLSLPGDSTGDVTETIILQSAPCEYGWIWYQGKCYYFSTILDTWYNSQEFCKSHNASLALIDNKEELDFLLRFKGPANIWIGLKRTNDNTAWIWTNGTLYNESLFTIQRSSPDNIEYVYLNHQSVKSEKGTISFRWICNRM